MLRKASGAFSAVTTNTSATDAALVAFQYEANANNRTVEDQADNVVPGKIAALLPSLPCALHLVPGPADGVLADRPAEQHRQGAPDIYRRVFVPAR